MARTSMTRSGRPPADDAILEWLEVNPRATALQIARALEFPKPTVYANLVRLERAGRVEIDGVEPGPTTGRQKAQFWSVRAATPEATVQHALRNQPALVKAWAQPLLEAA